MEQKETIAETEYSKFKDILDNNGIIYNQLYIDENSILLQTDSANSHFFRLTVFLRNPGSFFVQGWDDYTPTVHNALKAYEKITGKKLFVENETKEKKYR